MDQLLLYSRPDCHLCDVAEGLLHAAGLGDTYQKIDIESDLKLLRRYGIRVPVLFHNNFQTELFWPFDQAGLSDFMESGE